MKYKVGDKVKVIKHVKGNCGQKNCQSMIDDMLPFIGCRVTIKSRQPTFYEIKEDREKWS